MSKLFTSPSNIRDVGRIGVLCGGRSAEREVSLRSGEAVYQALSSLGADVQKIDVGDKPLQLIDQANLDFAFIALHGAAGEDGRIQALLELLGIPFTGSKVTASAIAMDKWRTKLILSGMSIPTPPAELLSADSDWSAVTERLGSELMVKPAHEGSSLGMSKVSGADALPKAYETALGFDSNVFAESVVVGSEYTVAVLDGEALPAIRLETGREFYDFQAKYESNDTGYHCPCGLPEDQEQILKQLAVESFTAVGCEGWGRVDFMCDQAGNFYVLEINTVPGMTDHSLVPMAAKQAGFSFQSLVEHIVLAAANRAGV